MTTAKERSCDYRAMTSFLPSDLTEPARQTSRPATAVISHLEFKYGRP